MRARPEQGGAREKASGAAGGEPPPLPRRPPHQLAAAFAFALVVSPGREEDQGLADLGGLLLATLLGLTYLNFIAVLVIWYGDLPHKSGGLLRHGAPIMSAEPDEPPPERVRARLAFVVGAVLLLLGGVFAAMAGFYQWLAPHRNFDPPRAFPKPSVLADQGRERRDLAEEQRRRLETPAAIRAARRPPFRSRPRWR